ncbi:MAG: hypothetical protein WC058_04195 [Phycisphaeraceae bacterium]
MTRQLIGIGIVVLGAAMLTGCGRDNPSEQGSKVQKATAVAADQAEIDAKATADAKVAADMKAEKDAKAAADQAATDLQAAKNAKVTADQAAVDAEIAADAKAAADIKAAEVAKGAAEKAAADAKVAADVKAAADLKAANAQIKVSADATAAKAATLLEQLQQQIKDGKLDAAQTSLTELDDMKGWLPASIQEKVETARTALKAKQTAANLVR